MKKVLLVEDDPFIRDLTTVKLADHQYGVRAVGSGEEALTYFDTEIPDVILLDLDLPDMNGLEILATVRASEKLASVPVIIFSNNDDQETRAKAEAASISGFFIKATTDYTELFALIDSLPTQ